MASLTQPANWKRTSINRKAMCSVPLIAFVDAVSRAWKLCELLPHTGSIADDILLIRSMTTGSVDHEAALRMIHSADCLQACPLGGRG